MAKYKNITENVFGSKPGMQEGAGVEESLLEVHCYRVMERVFMKVKGTPQLWVRNFHESSDR